jgi:hypothetical protein
MRTLHTLLLVLALAAASLSAAARPPVRQESPELIWEQVIQTDRFEYQYLNATLVREDDSVWVLYGLTPKGSLASPQSFQLAHLDGSGKSVGRFDLDTILKGSAAGRRYAGVLGLAPLGADSFALVVPTVGNGASLFDLDNKTARPLSEQKIHPESDLYLTKVVPSEDGSLLLLGHVGDGGWLAKVDASGKLAWERNLGPDGVAVLLDGVRNDDESFLLLGSPKGGTAPSSWVGKVTARGDLVLKNLLPRDARRIAGSADGSAILVGDRLGAQGREVWAMGLTPSLTESWNTAILSGVKSVAPFTVAAISGGGWVVFGPGKDYLPSISRVGRGGQLLWTYTHQISPKVVPIMERGEVLSAGQEIFALFTLASLNEAGEQRETVRVLKFTVR